MGSNREAVLVADVSISKDTFFPEQPDTIVDAIPSKLNDTVAQAVSADISSHSQVLHRTFTIQILGLTPIFNLKMRV